MVRGYELRKKVNLYFIGDEVTFPINEVQAFKSNI
jgi:hypothetical protein